MGFFLTHTSWYLSQRMRVDGSFHSSASHRDTGSQSLEDDRSDRFCKVHSHHVHVPLQNLVDLHKTEVVSHKTNQTFYFYHFYILVKRDALQRYIILCVNILLHSPGWWQTGQWTTFFKMVSGAPAFCSSHWVNLRTHHCYTSPHIEKWIKTVKLVIEMEKKSTAFGVHLSYHCNNVCSFSIWRSFRACSLPTPGIPLWKNAVHIWHKSSQTLFYWCNILIFVYHALPWGYNHNRGEQPDRPDSPSRGEAQFVLAKSCNSPQEGPT